MRESGATERQSPIREKAGLCASESLAWKDGWSDKLGKLAQTRKNQATSTLATVSVMPTVFIISMSSRNYLNCICKFATTHIFEDLGCLPTAISTRASLWRGSSKLRRDIEALWGDIPHMRFCSTVQEGLAWFPWRGRV